MISPTIVVTCAHVAGARPSQPEHFLYHFKAIRVCVNVIEAKPVFIGEDKPIYNDIALLEMPGPVIPDGLCFEVKHVNPELYAVTLFSL
jgi:hypothetical protein